MSSSRVSIVIPTRNRSAFLARAVEHAYLQNYFDLEVIVSDNNSTDDTNDVLKLLKLAYPDLVVVRHTTTIGIGHHWHTVVTHYATGDYILLIPDDDIIFDASYISDAVNVFTSNTCVSLVFARYISVDRDDNILKTYLTQWPTYISGTDLLKAYNNGHDRFVPHLTAVFRRSTYEKTLGFSCEFLSPDMFLWLQLLLLSDAYFFSHCVAKYMLHPGNLSRTIDPSLSLMDTKMIKVIRENYPYVLHDKFLTRHLSRIERYLYIRFHSAVAKQLFYNRSLSIRHLMHVKPFLFFFQYMPDVFARKVSSIVFGK